MSPLSIAVLAQHIEACGDDSRALGDLYDRVRLAVGDDQHAADLWHAACDEASGLDMQVER